MTNPIKKLDKEQRKLVAVYKSTREASRVTGVINSNIHLALRTGVKRKGFTWRYHGQ